MSLAGIHAVFFDLDDTLCAYWQAARDGLAKAFDRSGPRNQSTGRMIDEWATAFAEFYPTIKPDGWYDAYLKSGEPTRTELMRRTLERVGIDDPAWARRLGDAYALERERALRMFPDALQVLDALRGKFPLGLITNGPADVQRAEIRVLRIGSFFEHVFIEGEMGEGKPRPSVFRRAEHAAGRNPEQILFVGNSYAHDIRPAIEAGWKTFWIRRETDVAPSLGSAAHPEELPDGAPVPDMTSNDLRELLAALGA